MSGFRHSHESVTITLPPRETIRDAHWSRHVTATLPSVRGPLVESEMVTAISPHQLRYELRDGTLAIIGFLLREARS